MDGVCGWMDGSVVFVRLFVTLWTVAHQAPLSVELPSKNPEIGCRFLHQGIFLTQGSSMCFLHRQAGSLPLSHQGRMDQ